MSNLKLDEPALRRPDFRGGTPLILADGQEWFLPQPHTLWVADDSEEGASLGTDLGPDYDVLAKVAESATNIGQMARAVLKAARYLLLLNYTLDSAAISQLLRVDFSVMANGHPTGPEGTLANELIELVSGNAPGPKRSAGGDGSPSSPTA